MESLTFEDSEFMTPNVTGTIPKFRSETDPNLIDYIPVIDNSDSDSSTNEVFFDKILRCSSPIQWSPQRIECNKSQNLEKYLEELQQIHPQINKVEKGRVYEMDTIIAGIQSHTPEPEQAQVQSQEQARVSTRLRKRHDYKQANKKGFSDN